MHEINSIQWTKSNAKRTNNTRLHYEQSAKKVVHRLWHCAQVHATLFASVSNELLWTLRCYTDCNLHERIADYRVERCFVSSYHLLLMASNCRNVSDDNSIDTCDYDHNNCKQCCYISVVDNVNTINARTLLLFFAGDDTNPTEDELIARFERWDAR